VIWCTPDGKEPLIKNQTEPLAKPKVTLAKPPVPLAIPKNVITTNITKGNEQKSVNRNRNNTPVNTSVNASVKTPVKTPVNASDNASVEESVEESVEVPKLPIKNVLEKREEQLKNRKELLSNIDTILTTGIDGKVQNKKTVEVK